MLCLVRYYNPFYIHFLFSYHNQYFSFSCKLYFAYEMFRQLSSMRQVCMICCQNHYYSVYVNISIIIVISVARFAANFKFYGNHLRVLLRLLSMNASCYTSKFYRVINRNNLDSSKLKAYIAKYWDGVQIWLNITLYIIE